MSETRSCRVPEPAAPPPPERAPASITFYMTRGERAAVLRVLRAFHAKRTSALLAALGVEPTRSP